MTHMDMGIVCLRHCLLMATILHNPKNFIVQILLLAYLNGSLYDRIMGHRIPVKAKILARDPRPVIT